ncbi:hypothetical protein Lalb_Chr19g0131221 [Lupinus albus]|uniref:Uncharacterized protein n=1 Tax=Lupinus albus TaxID=3870 RepID=A0A6A4NKL7_LUPAL|nr:hypothetical protein Lalb_Chr19g0131221 [Lupinus albus]
MYRNFKSIHGIYDVVKNIYNVNEHVLFYFTFIYLFSMLYSSSFPLLNYLACMLL